ncbi:related to Pre-mRNA-splicing factor CWC24 [Melanopsichium pennsylvanicum]|uniref:Pre-mRNA-splicing factor CWC24 n=2 Tax=Melanopsichium pennsylvanicum TaxID=63383 RepID=A0AAJ4XMY7_9BASI|nr:conserved hypothetical protein [Melanopsichium pennsylvanicum 4]SNX84746.1 related to Pre-mRNA-splicing factor CWC24 [Melanopsichium pennsylvanicum]
MNASTESGNSPSSVVFKRKRGPPSRSNTSTSSRTVSSSFSSGAGPSRAPNNTSKSSESDSDDETAISTLSSLVHKKKRVNNNPLVQSTGSVLRKSKFSGGGSDDDPDDSLHSLDNDFKSKSSPSDQSRTFSTTNHSLEKIRDDATRHSDWDLETASSASKDATQFSNADGLYRGANSYSSYIATRDDGTSSKLRSRGPIRQTTTVRTTSLMDYQPDICKEYKETGYCGFGDTCKFLHDRSDYLAGWQLDVLPNSNLKARENVLSDPETDDKEQEEVPFACLICRKPFTDPVVTRCAHYFCSSCAIKRYAKNSKCFACGAQTGGLFNSATKVLHKMDKVKMRKEHAKAERNGWKKNGDEQPLTEFGSGNSDDE